MDEFLKEAFLYLQNIFWGNSSLLSLGEIIFRTTFMYIYTLFLVHIIGKRGVATLAPFEMAVIVVLGSVLADPMLNVKSPLIKGMVIMSVIVALERLLVHLTAKSTRIENLVESSPRQLVADGVINLESVHKEGFSRDDLFLSLRGKGIEQLGEVKCAFLETSGSVSVWTKEGEEVRPGLSLFPFSTSQIPKNFSKGEMVSLSGHYSCQSCGHTIPFTEEAKFDHCNNCHHEHWEPSSMVKVDATIQI